MTVTETGTLVPETGLASTEANETPGGGIPGTPEAEKGSQGLIEARDRYRTERDSAREELASANARIEAFQRAEVERLASADLSHPADLFTLTGNTPADYLGEDGNVDPEKVAADVAEFLAERPGLGKRRPGGFVDPFQGMGGKAPAKPQPSWAALLRG